MDADHKPLCAEVRIADCVAQRREEAMEREKLPLLAAYCDTTLTVEAAEQLVRMAEDDSYPAYAGEDLPSAGKAALLRKAEQLQQS